MARADWRAAQQTQIDPLVPATQGDGIVPEHPTTYVTAPATVFPLVPPIPAPQDGAIVPTNPVIVSPPVTPSPSAPPVAAPQDDAIVPTHPIIANPPATHAALAPLHTDLQTGGSSLRCEIQSSIMLTFWRSILVANRSVVDNFVYLRIGKMEMKGPLDSGTRLNFDGKLLCPNLQIS